jgi:hypothetical protein
MILPVSNRTADGADAGCFSGIGKQPALFAGRIYFNIHCKIPAPFILSIRLFTQTKCRLLLNIQKSSLHFLFI